MADEAYRAHAPGSRPTIRFEDLTPGQRAEIADAWERGATWSTIAAIWNVSRWTVDLVRESAGAAAAQRCEQPHR